MKLKNPFKKEKKQEDSIKILTEEPKKQPILPIVPAQKPQTEPTKEEAKQRGVRERLDEVNEKLDLIVPKVKEAKLKPFKFPFGIKSKLKALAKKNSVLVFLLKTNRTIEPLTAKIENDFIVVNDKYHNCSVDFIYMWLGKYPAIVLNEWDLNPIGTEDYYKAMESGRNVNAQTVIIRAIEQAAVEQKQKISGKVWIWIIIGAIIVGYILFAGQGKK